MFSTVNSSIFTNSFDGFLQNLGRVFQAYLLETGENIGIGEVLLSFNFYWGWILNLWVYSGFGVVIYPFPYKNFISLCEKVWSLSFSFVINPVTLEVISASFGHHSISTSFAHVPHALINIPIFINHPPFSMRLTIHPHSIVPIAFSKKHCPSTLFLIIFPISSILSS